MTHARPPDRCNRAALQAVLRRAAALGVPPDYGRRRGLRPAREPRRLAPIGTDIHGRAQWLVPPAARALRRMQEAARLAGIELQVVSAFRSAAYQLGILERKIARGEQIGEILKVNAAPGFSEHHSGRAVDLTTPGFPALEAEFEGSPAFAWLQANAGSHRFHLSYPRANRHGITYEPWHWCWHPRRR